MEIFIPPVLDQALKKGATLVVNISGGKDGQAMLIRIVKEAMVRGWACLIFALHCDLGQMEWKESIIHCQKISQAMGLDLVICKRPQGDLLDHLKAREQALAGTGVPFWPSPSARYCTSDHKRDQANKELRKYSGVVISAEGIRADESDSRRKKLPLAIRSRITTKALKSLSISGAIQNLKPGQRLGLTWFPLFYWTESDVYLECGHTLEDRDHRRKLYLSGQTQKALAGWGLHPAYVYGNDRVSCAICPVYGSPNDLRIGMEHNPGLGQELINLEIKSGYTFRKNQSINNFCCY